MKKVLIFIAGIFVGAALCFGVLYAIRAFQSDINYYEVPRSYESKSKATFNVFQVLGQDAALATEIVDYVPTDKVVLLLGDGFYSQQRVVIKNPKMIGTFDYTSKDEIPLTVPVIKQ